jgi:hypothetical protein
MWIEINSGTYDFDKLEGISTKGEHSTEYTIVEQEINHDR